MKQSKDKKILNISTKISIQEDGSIIFTDLWEDIYDAFIDEENILIED